LTTDKPDLAQEFEEMAYDPNNINKDLIMKLHQRLTEVEKLCEEMYRELEKLRKDL